MVASAEEIKAQVAIGCGGVGDGVTRDRDMCSWDCGAKRRGIVDDHEELFLRAHPVWLEGNLQKLLPDVLCRDLQDEVSVLRAAYGAVALEAPLLELRVGLLDEAGRAPDADGRPGADPDAELRRAVADVAELPERPLLELPLAGDRHGQVAALVHALVHRRQHVADRRHDEERPERRLPGELGDHGVGRGHRVAGHNGGRGAVVGVHDGHDGVLLAHSPAPLEKLVPPGTELDGALENEGCHDELLHLGLLFGLHVLEFESGDVVLGLAHDLKELGIFNTPIGTIYVILYLFYIQNNQIISKYLFINSNKIK